MAHKRFRFGGHGEQGGGHGDRPWVYFMIDSFFLVTQFFVLTFQVRTSQDLVLPHRLVGSGCPSSITSIPSLKTDVAISVNRAHPDSASAYRINGGESMDGSSVATKLTDMAIGKDPDLFNVRIVPGPSAKFGDVMPILNICKKLGFKECGIQPSRLK